MSESQKLQTLTKREREVLRELMAGKSNKEIASELNIKEHTVEHHLTHVLEKLGLRSRTEAALWAREHTLFDRDQDARSKGGE